MLALKPFGLVDIELERPVYTNFRHLPSSIILKKVQSSRLSFLALQDTTLRQNEL